MKWLRRWIKRIVGVSIHGYIQHVHHAVRGGSSSTGGLLCHTFPLWWPSLYENEWRAYLTYIVFVNLIHCTWLERLAFTLPTSPSFLMEQRMVDVIGHPFLPIPVRLLISPLTVRKPVPPPLYSDIRLSLLPIKLMSVLPWPVSLPLLPFSCHAVTQFWDFFGIYQEIDDDDKRH